MNRPVALFPLGAVLLSLIAFRVPELFVPLRSFIVPLLGLVMFGMGVTLAPADFRKVFRQPGLILFGLFLQYFLMPLIAWLVSQLLGLPVMLAAGLVLVGACPGGTASNVICYLARGDVALSITLTSLSTLAAVIMTPLLTWIYIGQAVEVPVMRMMLDIVLVIIVPVCGGLLVNVYLGGKSGELKKIFPLLSMLAIILIIAIIVAINQAQLTGMILPVMLAVLLHNIIGLTSGYWIPRWLGYNKKICRTLAIETGMQNSGLGVALAAKYFSATAALPGAVFSIWHNLSGALLAGIWSRQNDDH